jgi:polyphosphate kinase
MRARFLQMIEREIEHAKAGRTSGIVAKLNAISDEAIMEALYRASQAGVPIELLVRGLCELRPGVPGVSETIRVRSIVGRFLEHSRIFTFANDGDTEVYIGSADWMGRNLDRRVETIVPVLCPELRDRITGEILGTLMADNAQTRWLQADGTYVRRPPANGQPFSAQLSFLAAGRTTTRDAREDRTV